MIPQIKRPAGRARVIVQHLAQIIRPPLEQVDVGFVQIAGLDSKRIAAYDGCDFRAALVHEYHLVPVMSPVNHMLELMGGNQHSTLQTDGRSQIARIGVHIVNFSMIASSSAYDETAVGKFIPSTKIAPYVAACARVSIDDVQDENDDPWIRIHIGRIPECLDDGLIDAFGRISRRSFIEYIFYGIDGCLCHASVAACFPESILHKNIAMLTDGSAGRLDLIFLILDQVSGPPGSCVAHLESPR